MHICIAVYDSVCTCQCVRVCTCISFLFPRSLSPPTLLTLYESIFFVVSYMLYVHSYPIMYMVLLITLYVHSFIITNVHANINNAECTSLIEHVQSNITNAACTKHVHANINSAECTSKINHVQTNINNAACTIVIIHVQTNINNVQFHITVTGNTRGITVCVEALGTEQGGAISECMTLYVHVCASVMCTYNSRIYAACYSCMCMYQSLVFPSCSLSVPPLLLLLVYFCVCLVLVCYVACTWGRHKRGWAQLLGRGNIPKQDHM